MDDVVEDLLSGWGIVFAPVSIIIICLIVWFVAVKPEKERQNAEVFTRVVAAEASYRTAHGAYTDSLSALDLTELSTGKDGIAQATLALRGRALEIRHSNGKLDKATVTIDSGRVTCTGTISKLDCARLQKTADRTGARVPDRPENADPQQAADRPAAQRPEQHIPAYGAPRRLHPGG